MKSNKKLRVAVYGSAKTSKENIAVAQELGEWLAGLDCFLITGATTGISEAVVKGFNNKDSVGYSPTRNEIEAKRFADCFTVGLDFARSSFNFNSTAKYFLNRKASEAFPAIDITK